MSTNTLWLISAVLAPTFWALTNVLDSSVRKNFIKDDLTMTWLGGLMDLPMVLIFLWLGGFEIPTLNSFIGMVISGALWVFPIVLYFKALENDEASRVALLFQLLPLWTLIVAFGVLGETLSTSQFIAFFLIVTGGGLAAVKKTEGKWHFSKSIIFIGLATLLWAISDVFFKKFETDFSNFYSAFAIYFLAGFLTAFGMYLHARHKKKATTHLKNVPKKAWIMLATGVVSANIGLFTFAYALTLKESSLTAVIVGIQPLLVFLFGWILSKFIKEIQKETLSKESMLTKGSALVIILLGLWLI